MAIREELVASAAQFLQDPSVASSTIENKISFLRSKNLTQEEVDAALSRTSYPNGPPSASYMSGPPPGPSSGPPQPYYQPYPPQYAWQSPPPPPPRRDWRDWFIMATVVSGVGYSLYTLGKRYVYPLIAPPTPEKLEQDKKSIQEQFDRAFALVEQLAKDTEQLKTAEEQRTQRLDTALAELEAAMADVKSANRRREADADRIRDEVHALKEAIPKAMNNQKEVTNTRLSEINTELTSLKTLVSQRMSSGHAAASSPSRSVATSASVSAADKTGDGRRKGSTAVDSDGPNSSAPSGLNIKSPVLANGGRGGETKASIPAWQMAAASKSAGSNGADGDANGNKETGSSSSS